MHHIPHPPAGWLAGWLSQVLEALTGKVYGADLVVLLL